VGFGGASLATSRLSNIGKVLGKAGVTLGVQGVNIAARYLEETNKQTGSSKTYKQGGQIQLNQGGESVGSIDISTFSNTSTKTKGSVQIELRFKNKKSTLKNFNWIQTVRSNFAIGSDVNQFTEINDPNPPDDDKPFYWTDAEKPTQNTATGYDARFYDQPTRKLRAGQKLYWNGELSLVGQDNAGGYRSLVTISYGFTIDSSGRTSVQDIKVTAPSKFQNMYIKKQNEKYFFYTINCLF
jgi:hypothetical protein